MWRQEQSENVYRPLNADRRTVGAGGRTTVSEPLQLYALSQPCQVRGRHHSSFFLIAVYWLRITAAV